MSLWSRALFKTLCSINARPKALNHFSSDESDACSCLKKRSERRCNAIHEPPVNLHSVAPGFSCSSLAVRMLLAHSTNPLTLRLLVRHLRLPGGFCSQTDVWGKARRSDNSIYASRILHAFVFVPNADRDVSWLCHLHNFQFLIYVARLLVFQCFVTYFPTFRRLTVSLLGVKLPFPSTNVVNYFYFFFCFR